MLVVNPKALSSYQVNQTLEAGIKLTGPEVKSVKTGRLSLKDAYVKIIGSEAYLVGALIPLYPYARPENYQADRTRKLLLHKKEIIALKTKIKQSGLTLVPLKCYTKGGLIKLLLGLAKGKKKYEKREELKKRAIEREIQRTLRGKF